MKNIKYVLLTILALCSILTGLYFVAQNDKTNKVNNFRDFELYSKRLALPLTAEPITRSSTVGCFKSEKYYDENHDGCTFGYSKVYILDSSYRDSAVQIKTYLYDNGYIFKSPNDERAFNSDIANSKLADDLSNGTPLVTDFFNAKQDIELRLSIGDRKRLIPTGYLGEPDKLHSTIAPSQLVAKVQLTKEY